MEQQYLNPTSIETLGGAAVAVVAITNAFRQVFNFPPAWTAFISSIVISYLRTIFFTQANFPELAFAFVNGCVLYCTASGMNEIAAPRRRRGKRLAPSVESGEDKGSSFFGSWFNN